MTAPDEQPVQTDNRPRDEDGEQLGDAATDRDASLDDLLGPAAADGDG